MTDLHNLTNSQLTSLQDKQAKLTKRMTSKQARAICIGYLVDIERELKVRQAQYIPTLVRSL